MTSVGWYLRRAVPWTALLGCCAGAVVVTALLDRWPTTAVVLLPTLLGCCAAAASFTFDETSLAVVEVTPRGATWRRMARLVVAGVPLVLWLVAVQVRPGHLDLHRPGWWLLGAGAIALAVGAAALGSRHSVPHPGSTLAAAIALAALAPVVVAAFLGLDSPYPIGEFPERVALFWAAVAAAGAGCCVAGLRPAIRH